MTNTVEVLPNQLNYSVQGVWVFLNELRLAGNPKGEPTEKSSWIDRVSWFELDKKTCMEDTRFIVNPVCVLDQMEVSVVHKGRTLFILPVSLDGISVAHPNETIGEYIDRVAVRVVNKMFGEIVNEITNQKYADESIPFDAWHEPIIFTMDDWPLASEEVEKALGLIQKLKAPDEIPSLEVFSRKPKDTLFRTFIRNGIFIMTLDRFGPNGGRWEFTIPMKVIERSAYSSNRVNAKKIAQEAWTRFLQTYYIKALREEILEINQTIEQVMRSGDDSVIAAQVSKEHPL